MQWHLPRALVVFAGMLSWFLSTSAAKADCKGVITKEIAGMCGSFPNGKLEADTAHLKKPLGKIGAKCGAGSQRVVVSFGEPPKAEEGKPAPPPPDALVTLPQYKEWMPVVTTDADACPKLVDTIYVEKPTAPPKAQVEETNAATNPLFLALTGAPALGAAVPDSIANSAEMPLILLKSYRRVRAGQKGFAQIPGTGTSATDAAVTEAVQILGQIVVDRASARGYELLKDKLIALLGCNDDYTSSTEFHATCRVLLPLRIEDIAMSRDALLAALVKDALDYVRSRAPGVANAEPLLLGPLPSSIAPLVTKPGIIVDDAATRAVLDAITSYAGGLSSIATSPVPKVIVVATVAYLRCITPPMLDDKNTTPDVGKMLARCDIGAHVDELSGGDKVVLPAAHALAQRLVAIGTPTPAGGDPRVRLTHAIDTLFSATCMVLDDEDKPQLACKDPNKLLTAQDGLGLALPIIDAALARDTNATLVAIVHALQVGNARLASKSSRRAFVILGGLLDYGATFAPAGQVSGEAAKPTAESVHEQRTRILESLTRSMTDRTGRAGDTIYSLGGAFRAVAGGRLAVAAKDEAAFYGPLGLPLGIAVTHLSQDDAWCQCGFHAELDILDLGNYVAYDNKLTVKSPEIEDAIAPSLTVGAAFGANVPLVVGATIGYSPHFVLNPDKPAKPGSRNVGATVGFHVPLLDMN
jgi:hypothetical protein